MSKTKTPRLGQQRWSASTDTVSRVDFDTDAALLDERVLLYAQGTLAARPNPGVEGTLYTVVGDTSVENGKQFYYDGTNWLSVTKELKSAVISSGATADTSLTVTGIPSQTGDIFRVQTSDGQTRFVIGPSGIIALTENTFGGGYGARFAMSSASNRIVDVVRGAAGQTANLTEWQTSSGSVVARMSNVGDLTLRNVYANYLSAPTGWVGNLTASLLTNNRLDLNATDASQIAAHITGSQYQSANIFRVQAYSGIVGAQVDASGHFFANTASIGGSSLSFGAATITGIEASKTVLTLRALPSQSAYVLNYLNASGASAAALKADGSWLSSGSANFSGGFYNMGATTIYGSSYQPDLEIRTGNGTTGGYTDWAVLRHVNPSSAATTRAIYMAMKLAGEANASESARSVAIGAKSTSAYAYNPYMSFVVGNTERATLDENGTFNASTIRRNPGYGVAFDFGYSGAYAIGIQSSTIFQRSGSWFAWYGGGSTQGTAALDAGDGNLLASLQYTDGFNVTAAGGIRTSTFKSGSGTGQHLNINHSGIASYTDTNENSGGQLYIGYVASSVNHIGASNSTNNLNGQTYIDSCRIQGVKINVQPSAPSTAAVGDIWIKV